MTDCIFCKMASGEIQPDVVYEDDQVLAFKDISPQAPVHVLIVPRQHIASINELQAEHGAVVGRMFLAAAEVAKRLDIADSGYRTVMNCNSDGGQTVYHLHLHVLGGRRMNWPPG